MIRTISSIAFFLILLISWEIGSRSGLYSPVLLPSPLNVLEYIWQSGTDGTLWSATLVTMKRLLLGYGIGLLAGLPSLVASTLKSRETRPPRPRPLRPGAQTHERR